MQRAWRNPRATVQLLGLTGVGALVGWGLSRLGVPLPWMLGPLFTMIAATLAGVAPPVPVPVRYFGQLLIATAVAMNVTPAALQVIAAHLPLMLLCALAGIMFSMVLALVLERLTSLDLPSALFSSLPGGAIEMAALTERYGGNPAVVAFGQTLRLAAVVTIVPPVLILLGVPFKDVARELEVGGLGGPAMAVALAVAFSIWLHRLRLANAFFIGPLLSVGVATALGAPFGVMPGVVTGVAQVALGVALGAMFKPASAGSTGELIAAVSSVALLIGFGFSIALVLSSFSAEPFALLALANAPGSVAEMAVAAKGMSVDSALVTSYHLVRIAIVVPFSEAIFRIVRFAGSLAARER